MDLQSLIVAVAVGGSGVYVFWTLLPQAGRRGLANHLLRWPLPRALVDKLQQLTRASAGGCNCSGCDRAPGAQAGRPGVAGTQALVFHPRKRA